MNEPISFASLTPGLLARKGAARPAMRPQFQPLQQFHDATARQLEDDPSFNDLGFNDLGFNDLGSNEEGEENVTPLHQGDVVALKPVTAPVTAPVIADAPVAQSEVRRQQDQIAASVSCVSMAGKRGKERRSALAEGRSAAFTLRLDAERHLQLRLACTLANRSAQQLVTEALDHMLANLPEVTELAARVGQLR